MEEGSCLMLKEELSEHGFSRELTFTIEHHIEEHFSDAAASIYSTEH